MLSASASANIEGHPSPLLFFRNFHAYENEKQNGKNVQNRVEPSAKQQSCLPVYHSKLCEFFGQSFPLNSEKRGDWFGYGS
jgi:hypothetical protein